MAYSKDMRERALELIESGKRREEVSKLLRISESSLKRWQNRQRQGCLAAEYPAARGSYKIDEERLQAHVAEKPDAYLYEIAEDIVSKPSTVRDALKRLKITRKKRPRNIGNETKRSAPPILKK